VAVITLTTDFGTRDTYVAEMKGAILSITREVHLVDITHEVTPHHVLEGALALEAAAPRFPAATIHVGVVDPGVGTARRGLAVASRDQMFVGPDNGLFTPFFDDRGWRAFELRSAEFRRTEVCHTFHGRDIFAPVAAHLARGVEPAQLGPPVTDPIRLTWPEARVGAGTVGGAVLHVDRFGNLVTSIHADAIDTLGADVTVRVAGKSLPLVRTYGDLRRRSLGALVGSSNRLEIAVNTGSAAKALGIGPGARVVVSRTSSSGRQARRTR